MCVCIYTMANLMNECEFGIPHSFNAFQPLKQKKMIPYAIQRRSYTCEHTYDGIFCMQNSLYS